MVVLVAVLAGRTFAIKEKQGHKRFFLENQPTLECVAGVVRESAGPVSWGDTPFGPVLAGFDTKAELFDECDMSVFDVFEVTRLRILLHEDGSVAILRFSSPGLFVTFFSFLKSSNSAIEPNKRIGSAVIDSSLGEDWYYVIYDD